MGRLLKDHLQDLPDRDHARQRRSSPSPYDFLMKREWEWSVRDQATMLAMKRGLARRARPAAAQALPRPAGAVRPDRRQRRRDRGRARPDDRDGAPPAARRGAGPVRRAGDGGALPRALQRQLVDEPDPGHLHGAGLLLQLLPRGAGRPQGRRGDPLPPAATRASTSCTTRRTSTSTRRCWPSRPTRPWSGRSTSSSSRPTRGTSTSTAPRTPTTASTRSTCGTGRRTRWTTSTR